MTKKVVFMMGSTGAGKSFVRALEYGELAVLDCDSIKEHHPDYDPNNPTALHCWSSAECQRRFYAALAGDHKKDFVLDGTGANAERLVKNIEDAQAEGYLTEVCYVTASLKTCKERNAKRTRTVPEDVLVEKYNTVATSFKLVAPYADFVRVIENN